MKEPPDAKRHLRENQVTNEETECMWGEQNLEHRGPVPAAVMADIAAAVADRNRLLAEQEEREKERSRQEREAAKARRRQERAEKRAWQRKRQEERARKLHARHHVQVPDAVMARMKDLNPRWSTEDIRLVLEPWGNCYLFNYLGYDMAIDFDGTLWRLR